MDVTVWTRISRLLDEALDLPPAERTRWVSALGPEYEPLKPRLLALLAHAPSIAGSDFLGSLPLLEDEDDGPPPGESARVGPYRIIRQIGSGGMGTVWLAARDDGTLRRTVALKLPHGVRPHGAIAERMLRERDILAALTHPGIARLYDAGIAPGGRPFLALEYVEGRPIDVYCREQGLDVPGRLRVFLQVVQAVAYAHAQLVVHRDLKPSNVLVTADGQVRLLDFGIAKLLDAGQTHETVLTEMAGRPHTPEYASPEQISGGPLSTATDIYSLGVVLYELLTGRRPQQLRQASHPGMHDAILRDEVPPPSTVADASTERLLRGDLDTIVLKALRRQPQERYATVNAFGDDVQRYLDGRPVLARPDSHWYRLKKLVARNRLAAAATAGTAVAIVAGAGISAWQAQEARVQRNVAIQEKIRADAQAEAARRSARIARANAELTDFVTADVSAARSTTGLEQQLERAVVTVRSQYSDDPLLRLNLLLGIAGRFRQLGSFDRHRQLVSELEATAAAANDGNAVAQLQCWRARDLSQAGQAAAARQLMDQVLTGLRRRDPAPNDVLISCLADESAIARLAGDSPRAIAAVEEVRRLEEAEGLVRTDGHTDTLLLLSRAYSQAGRYREAAQAAARSVELRRDIGRAGTAGMMNVQIIRATILREGGQPHLALPILTSEMAAHVARGGAPASVPPLDYETGLTLVRLGRPADALPPLSRAAAAARERGDVTLIRASSVARMLAFTDKGQFQHAADILAATEPLYTKLRAEQQYTARQFLFAGAHLALATGDAARASTLIEEARTLLARLKNDADPAWRVFHTYDARLALARNRAADAERAAAAALALSRQQAIDPEASVFVGEDLLLHARALRALGDDARAKAQEGLARMHLRPLAQR